MEEISLDFIKQSENKLRDHLHFISAKINKMSREFDLSQRINYNDLNDIRVKTAQIELLHRKMQDPLYCSNR